MMAEKIDAGTSAPPEIENLPIIVIQPPKGLVSLGLKELWEYWELLYFLTWRDIKVRYKQTLLGGVWAILQPFCMMVVFSLFLESSPEFLRTMFPIRYSPMRVCCPGLFFLRA